MSHPSALVPAATGLPLVGMRIVADACNGIARVVVEQRFHNPHNVPLSVSYLFPLPADAAVSGYAFVIGDRRIQGEIARRTEARERFEEALVEGRSAALLEQERTSMFTQEIANIPPGADVVAELILDQPLRWLDEGAWEWRFPTAAAPRYLAGPGEVPDAARVQVSVADAPIAARAKLQLSVRDPFKEGARVESPSHALRIEARSDAQHVHADDDQGVALDRDIVVRWRVAGFAPGFTVDLGRSSQTSANGRDAFALCTVIPPAPSPTTRSVPRDVIVLLDTSGSMGGEPLEQARRVVSALVDTLNDRDQLELIEFSSQPRRWKRGAVSATIQNRRDALTWLAGLRASGGTEMRSGITEAMATLRSDSQRQIVLVTDGQIGFESQVVAELLAHLPRGARLHTVGVGSAVNRSLTGPAARVGRGVEVIVGLGEDPERAAARLVARTSSPIVVDVTLEGSALLEHAPARLADLFAGAPLLVSAKVRAEGGELLVRGRTVDGPWEAKLAIPAMAHDTGNRAVVALFGREKVEDLELAQAARPEEPRDAAIEETGLAFSIATRLTSWVAVSETVSVDPRDPTRRERIPQALPYGMSVEGLGLRRSSIGAASGSVQSFGAMRGGGAAPSMPRSRGSVPLGGPPPRPSRGIPLGGPPPPSAGRPAAPPAAPPAARSAAPPPAAPSFASLRDLDDAPDTPADWRLEGRVVSTKDGVCILEIVAGAAGLAWNPEALGYVAITRLEGDDIAVRVDLARTTRAATLAAGEIARLALSFDGTPTQVSFEIMGRRVTVKLSA